MVRLQWGHFLLQKIISLHQSQAQFRRTSDSSASISSQRVLLLKVRKTKLYFWLDYMYLTAVVTMGCENGSLASYKIIVCTLLTCKQTHMISVILYGMLGTALCSGSLKSFNIWRHYHLIYSSSLVMSLGTRVSAGPSWPRHLSDLSDSSEPFRNNKWLKTKLQLGVKLLLYSGLLWRSTVASRKGQKKWLMKWLIFHFISFSSRASRHLKKFTLKKVYHWLTCTFAASFSTFSP